MKYFHLFVLCISFSVFFAFSSFAVDASPSDASYEFTLEDFDDLDEMEQFYLLEMFFNSFSGPGIASGSNASLSNIESAVNDIRSLLVSSPSDADSEVFFASEALAEDVSLSAFSDDFTLTRNVVIYEGSWNAQSYRLVIPAENEKNLFVDTDGSLYNVGTSNIVGRLFSGNYDPLDYEIDVFTLTPTLGNNASSLYNNRYPSFNRHYYESGGRLYNTDTYGLFKVTKTVHTVSDDNVAKNGVYLLALFMMGGIGVLCLFKR